MLDQNGYVGKTSSNQMKIGQNGQTLVRPLTCYHALGRMFLVCGVLLILVCGLALEKEIIENSSMSLKRNFHVGNIHYHARDRLSKS